MSKRKILHVLGKLVPPRAVPVLRSWMFQIHNREFRPYVKRMTADDIAFDFIVGDRTAQEWYEGNWFAPEIRFIKKHMVKPGDVVIECGAHQGCLTILFSHWVGKDGKVIAFEAVPHNANILQRNIELNMLQNVLPINKAVGARAGTIAVTSESSGQIVRGTNSGLRVDMTCLDEFAAAHPTALKIDVEGYEVEVLKGAKHILERCPKLMIEIHAEALGKYGTSVREILELIDASRYKIWIQWEDDEDPEPYDFRRPITKRIHLFALPVG